MSNATLGSEPEFGGNGRPVLLVNELIDSAVHALTGLVLFAVLFLNQTHIETNDAVKLFGELELFLRLAATGAAGILGVYGFVFDPKVRLGFFSFPGAWVLGILLFCLLGTLCSPDPHTSLPYFATLSSITLFAPFALSVVGTKRFIDLVLASMLLSLVGSWFLYIFMPDYGVMIEYISNTESVSRMGGTSHPNTLSGIVVLMIVILAYLYFEGKRSLTFCLPLLALGIATMIYTGTRVAVVAAVFSTLFVYRGFWRRVDVLPFTAGLLVVLLLVAMTLFSSENSNPLSSSVVGSATRSGDVDEITSVTGRSKIWTYIVEEIYERPLVGYGPGLAKYYLDNKGLLLHAHNAVLHLAFAGGVFAGACAVMMFLSQLLISIGGKYRLAALLSFVIILNSLTEVPIFDYIPGTPTVLWMAALFWPVLDDGSL